jgi:hypothetical protein
MRFEQHLAEALKDYLEPSAEESAHRRYQEERGDLGYYVSDWQRPLVVDVQIDGPEGDAAAMFDPERRFRYLLLRQWDHDRPPLVFLMLNPSTADAFRVDPTVQRCVNRARAHGYGGAVVLNIFALRSTDPRALLLHDDPQGPLNDEIIRRTVGALMAATRCADVPPMVVCAWGSWGAKVGNGGGRPGPSRASRGNAVLALLHEHRPALHCLAVNADGSPRHPLYVRSDAPLVRYAA